MRRGSNPAIFLNDKTEQLEGFGLSADYCAEHEWGISDMKEAFGCDPQAEAGMPRRKIHNTHVTTWRYKRGNMDVALTHFFQDENFAVLFGNCDRMAEIYETLTKKGKTLTQMIEESDFSSDLRPPFFRDEDWDVAAAWDGKEFGIVVPASNAALLKELKEHFDNKNIVIMMGGRETPFENPGLVFAVADRLPQEMIDAWREGDLDHERLMKRHEEIGIEAELKETWGADWKSGCRWHALSPRWKFEESHFETEYDVIYWLNPLGQEDNLFGWVTVEDLRLWKLGRGPIPGAGRNPSEKIKALKEHEDACYKWMIDRLVKDGCPEEEAEKYSFNQFIEDFYHKDWAEFVEDAVASAEHQEI